MKKINILVVDDHGILREGIKALLSYHQEVEVVGEAHNGQQAIEKADQLEPDIILMDIAMPEIDGIAATKAILKKCPNTKILVLSQYTDKEYIIPMLKLGIAGFISKRALGDELIAAIYKIMSGEKYIHSNIASVVIDEISEKNELAKSESPSVLLTDRESEILNFIVMGFTTRQIANKLKLSFRTVDWHRSNIMNKLHTRSVADLVRFAIINQLVDVKSNSQQE